MEEHAFIIPALPFKVQTSLFGISTNEDVDSLDSFVLYPFVPRLEDLQGGFLAC